MQIERNGIAERRRERGEMGEKEGVRGRVEERERMAGGWRRGREWRGIEEREGLRDEKGGKCGWKWSGMGWIERSG